MSAKRKPPKFRVGQVVCWDGGFWRVTHVYRDKLEVSGGYEGIHLPRKEFVRPLTKKEAGR
jgi:hypothetical protein